MIEYLIDLKYRFLDWMEDRFGGGAFIRSKDFEKLAEGLYKATKEKL